MCGLPEVFSYRSSSDLVGTARFTRMPLAMSYRGFDAAGTWIDLGGRVQLGHRRLSIIDPYEACNQSVVDTEVLLKGYLHWGEGLLLTLRDMFALAPRPALTSDMPESGLAIPMGEWLEATSLLDCWRGVPSLNHPSSRWSRRLADAMAADWLENSL